MNTPDLFEHAEAHARASDPETSHEAAADMRGRRANALEALVVSTIQAAGETLGGLTTHEISERSGVAWGSITPRLRPLRRKGLVADSGVRRPSPYGKRCIVWRAL